MLGFIITLGEAHDAMAYDALMQTDDVRPKALLGDKGYDSDAIREDSWFHGTDPVIPTKSNRKVQRPVDPVLYTLIVAHKIENVIFSSGRKILFAGCRAIAQRATNESISGFADHLP